MKMLAVGIANYSVHLLSYPIHSQCHYFHTLLIPSQELIFLWKPVASLNFHPKFSILMCYSCPSSPVCLEIIFSYSPIKKGNITLPLHFELGLSNNQATLRIFTKRQRYVDKMFDCCPLKLDGEMLPLCFGFWPK